MNGPIKLAGYAAIFNILDKGGDIIRNTAFENLNKNIPLLWQHDPNQKIGEIEYLQIDKRGLRVIAALNSHDHQAAELLRNGSVRGLSFGYRVHRSRGNKPRELLALDVAEISLITFPMQPLAKVHLVQ